MFLALKKISPNSLLINNLKDITGIGHARTKLLFQHLRIPKIHKCVIKTIGYKKLRGMDNFIRIFYTVRNKLQKLISIKYHGKFLAIGYKNLRKIQGLPCRGQRTHSNANTASKIKNFIKVLTKKVNPNKKI